MRIEKSSFKVMPYDAEYKHLYYFQSWYSPIFLKDRHENDGDNSTCITFEVRKSPKDKHYTVMSGLLPPAILDSHEVITHAKNLNNDFTNNTLHKLPTLYDQHCVIVPGNENINNIFSASLQRDNVPIRRLYIESNGVDIEGLIHQAIQVVRDERFYIVTKPKQPNALRVIDNDFINMITTYPDMESYALVYAWAQGLVYANKFLYIFDDRKPEKRKPIDHGYGV